MVSRPLPIEERTMKDPLWCGEACRTLSEEGVRLKTRQWVFLSLLVALSVVLARVASIRIAIAGVEGIRIGFGGLPIILAGLMFGPLAGAIVGAVADVLGYMINPMGAYVPHFTLTSALTGAIPGWMMLAQGRQSITKLKLIIAIAVGQVITSVLMVPWFLNMLFGIPFAPLLLPRIVAQVIQIPVFGLLSFIIMERTAKQWGYSSWSAVPRGNEEK